MVSSFMPIFQCSAIRNQRYHFLSKSTSSEFTFRHANYSYAPPRISEKKKMKRMMMSRAMYDNAASSSSASNIARPLANFESNLWGHHFLSYTSEQTEISMKEKDEHEELKETVRKMLSETPDNCARKLVLIDTIQRLGVAYHFHDEIQISIQNIFDASDQEQNTNLYVVALRFRLVRQHGHCMSSDVFKKFITPDGRFKESIANDVEGLLSLYEATHLRVHDEEILEEALAFTTTRLESLVHELTYSLKVQVAEALRHPVRKTVPRIGARKYISIYQNHIDGHDDLLLKFAKLDFNMLQKLHQRELSELTSWWKEDVNLANKLPYARDKLVEAYLWGLGLYFEPQYSRARQMIVKVLKLISFNDDTFDAYATFDELVLFNDAIQRWDISAMDPLPPYMRHLYQVNLDVYNEIEESLVKEGKSDRVYYGKSEMQKLLRAYFKEAEWLNARYIPKCEEYIKNALVSCAVGTLATNSLVGMGEFMTKDIFEWITSEPSIVRATSVICRFMDDIVDHEVQQQREHVASVIECYINEYGVSKEEAYVVFRKEVKNAWKVVNKALLQPTEVPIFVLDRVLNLTCLFDTFFQDGDGYTDSNSKCKDIISLLLVEPVNM